MTRFPSEHPLKTAALILLALLTVALSATARHRKSSDSEPGTFDYYLLSLSWSPAFCLSDPGAAECNGPRRFGFIVHGLWPQYEKGWPENCNVHQQVPENVVSSIADIMPARGLVYHEWSAHGTCSGLDPTDFFALVRRAYAGVAVPASLSGATHEIERSPSAIAAEFLHATQRSRRSPSSSPAPDNRRHACGRCIFAWIETSTRAPAPPMRPAAHVEQRP